MIDLSVSPLCLDKEVLLNPLEFLHEMSIKYIIPPGPLTFEHIKQLPACLYDQERSFLGQKKISQFVQNRGLEGQELLYHKYKPPVKS